MTNVLVRCRCYEMQQTRHRLLQRLLVVVVVVTSKEVPLDQR